MNKLKKVFKSRYTYIILGAIMLSFFFTWFGSTFTFQNPIVVRFQTPILLRYPKPHKITPTPVKKAKGVQIKPIVKEVRAVENTIKPEKKFLTESADIARTRGLEYLSKYYKGDELTAIDNLIKRESGWRVDAVNSESGAGGIPQALPFSKTGCGMTEKDLECQLQWMIGYINQRYGNPVLALEFHNTNGWY